MEDPTLHANEIQQASIERTTSDILSGRVDRGRLFRIHGVQTGIALSNVLMAYQIGILSDDEVALAVKELLPLASV